MNIINYLTSLIVPFFILCVLVIGLKEKVPIFDTFIKGCEDGVKVVFKIFPNLIALFLAINIIQVSGLLGILTNLISPITNILGIPEEILPLALLRPISGSGSMALLEQNLEVFGVDSYLGKVSATIMGAAETTFFTIAIYSSVLKTKVTKQLVIAALSADLAVILSSVYLYKIF